MVKSGVQSPLPAKKPKPPVSPSISTDEDGEDTDEFAQLATDSPLAAADLDEVAISAIQSAKNAAYNPQSVPFPCLAQCIAFTNDFEELLDEEDA